jgi:hypothetical protein
MATDRAFAKPVGQIKVDRPAADSARQNQSVRSDASHALPTTEFFRIRPNRVIELGGQFEIKSRNDEARPKPRF